METNASRLSYNFVIVLLSKATVVGITKSKLDVTVLDGEINTDGFELTRSDKNRHRGGVVCDIRNYVHFSLRSNFSNKVENFFYILLPKIKPAWCPTKSFPLLNEIMLEIWD